MIHGWRYGAFIGAVSVFFGLALYPIAVKPYRESATWRQIQTQNREDIGIEREDRQPGGMKVWADPFERK